MNHPDDKNEDYEETLTDDHLLRYCNAECIDFISLHNRRIESDMLMDMTLLGIPQIGKVFMNLPDKSQVQFQIVVPVLTLPQSAKMRVEIDDEGNIQEIRDWILETEGSNILRVIG